MSCCDTSAPSSSKTKSELTIALAGNPNSGKTTIFNALTGLRQKVANYPGVTVEKKFGRCKLPDGRWAEIIDLPGTYSLISRSPDERVAMEVLRAIRKDVTAPDLVIVVVDASNLQRNLYLVSQLIELGRPMVVALNMMDVAERRGVHVSPEGLQRQLGVPVVPVVAHKRHNIDKLKEAILRAKVAPLPDFELPQAMKDELLVVGGGLAILDGADDSSLLKAQGTRSLGSAPRESHGTSSVGFQTENAQDSLTTPVTPRSWICRNDDDVRRLDRYQALAERLLIGDRADDVDSIASREPVASLLQSATARMTQLGIDPMQADIEAHYRWIENVASGATATLDELAAMGAPAPKTLEYESRKIHLSDQVDAIFMHKIWGFVVFGAIMGLLFVSIFWFAAPLMDGIQSLVGKLGSIVANWLPEGPIHDLWTDGIVAGVGAVVVFVPQIAILFMFLAILEDSGYLARAAFLMDRVLAKVGLQGKSFIPLLSSFACAIPGIMATRTIEDRKSRLATIFVAPFMSCSARLPVYTLLIGTFFATFSPAARGGIMLSLYALGIFAAAGTAWLFKRSMLKGPIPAFILEMPSYKVPQLSQVVRAVYMNTGEFLKKAGTTIFVLSVILWALTYYPRLPAAQHASIGSAIELRPIVGPLAPDAPVYAYLPSDGYAKELLLEPGLVAIGPSSNPPKPEITRNDLGERYYSTSEYQSGKTPQERKHWADEQRELEVAKAVAGEQLRYSFAGRFGHTIEPVIKPLGYDWKMGVGLVGAFAAREVFVSTMGIVYSVGDVGDETTDLSSVMRADRYPDGRPVWTPLVAVSLLVWFVLAMQCMSTLAIVRRETGGWRWPLAMLFYMNTLAYVVSLLIYQFGQIWFA